MEFIAYALNYNYINAEMAKDIDGFKQQEIADTEAEKYSGYTQQTVDRKKDTAWNKDNLKKSVIASSLLLLGASAVMKRSANSAVEKNRNSAIMHSNGMGTDAENKARLDGMYRAEDMAKETAAVYTQTALQAMTNAELETILAGFGISASMDKANMVRLILAAQGGDGLD